MNSWLIAISVYLIVALVCYIAILVFFPPTPRISEHKPTDSSPQMPANHEKLRHWDPVVLIGFPLVVILSPLFLVIASLGQARKKS